MFYLQLISLLLLLSLGRVSCQSGAEKEVRNIPQWGTGLIAVTVFLFLVLVIYVANTYMKKKSKSKSDPTEGSKTFCDASVSNGTFGHYTSSSNEHEHAYENPIEVHDNVLTTPM